MFTLSPVAENCLNFHYWELYSVTFEAAQSRHAGYKLSHLDSLLNKE